MRRVLDGSSKISFPPPWWKVKREAFRVGRQIDDFCLRTTGVAAMQLYLRHVIDPKVVRKAGALTLTNRVAIYVIYPANGLLPSHLIALDYIRQCGYVPVVVTNLKLPAEAERDILDRSAALITRPNFGYDFGGYRDGVRFILPHVNQIDHLAFFNDSTWFPLNPDRDWLKEAEGLGADYVGSVSHCGMDPDGKWDFRKDPWVIDPNYRIFHYCSFSILMSGRLVQSPEFAAFWRNYRATDDKPTTIVRGEIGLSRMVMASGFSHAATLASAKLGPLLAELPEDHLRRIAEEIVIPASAPLRAEQAAVLADKATDGPALRNLILRAVVKQGPAYALAPFDITERTGNFLKKSPVVLNEASAQATFRFLETYPSPEAKVFLDEAREMYRRKPPQADAA
ncbi:rhamnan synthesis F family protein [Neotabrizicola shimadae]|uniref:Rhamnan synthesis protein F n=1 Tax=Neotabrizicola shimadae TaxID=2807096 RepID=A0A8G0ZSG7_9RHOB|nr:rhamnan synthesis F family protein [Neotabrizicola shimadae]QYZ69273.1 hypothetical protein JO391_16260 [Neotabrizicola shimadae]